MFLSKKHLSRRRLLQGAGAAIGLPLLDAMIPAGTALAQTAAAPRTRLGFVYFPHGIVQQFWQPKTTGRDFEFSHVLKPLESLRDYVTVVSGLRNKGAENSPAPHFTTEVSWLTCVGRNGRESDGQLGISVDQYAARHIGQDTPLPSLEICTEPGGYSSLAYRTPVQQLEMESNPRKVFYTLFGQGDSNDERKQIVRTTGSLLDYVRDATASLNKEIDAGDRAIVSGYLDSVREIERRVQKLKASENNAINLPDAPGGAPDDFTELLDVQFELMALAWQTNQTRITSMRMANEVSMRVYHWLNVSEAFHPLSHHGEDPEKIQRLLRVQVYHTERIAKFAQRLKGIRDGEKSLLDNSLILFGSNMANSDLHNADPVPSALIGRAAGTVKGNQHLHYPQDTPHANLLVTIAQRAGVPLEKMADSTGAFAEV
ncbi:MAG TPA: DUF1552 domain-containing protein [Steroidobacteraceae bacterium]|nr:DUF1552 domain-containing protein [Steroidobacteraceae bacterium]